MSTPTLDIALDLGTTLADVQSLYDRGLFSQALTVSAPLGPLQDWTGTERRLLAGRLAGKLGSNRLATWHFAKAWRNDRSNALTAYYHSLKRSPWDAWKLLKTLRLSDEISAETRAAILSSQGLVLTTFRDFERAETFLLEARNVAPESARILTDWSRYCEGRDRYEEALQAAGRALEIRPHYVPAISQFGYLLSLEGTKEKALEYLLDAEDSFESAGIASQILLIAMEIEDFELADRFLQRVEELSPILDKDSRSWIESKRSDVAYHLDDYERSAAAARLVGSPAYAGIAAALERSKDDPSPPIKLTVPFVRQHYMTCGPATLTAIAEYYGHHFDHLEVADEICYFGTSDAAQRRWVENNGLYAREFRLTAEGAHELLDRDIPFTVSTVEETSAHLQAVVGYDKNRGLIYVRDPYEPLLKDWLVEKFLEHYASTGPRALAFVPEHRRSQLQELELPDADLYDLSIEIREALDRHDPTEARRIFELLRERDPGHRLCLEAEYALAFEEGDLDEVLRVTDTLLERFPCDPRLVYKKVPVLQLLGRRDEVVDWMWKLRAKESTVPSLDENIARALLTDSSEASRCRYLYRRSLAQHPQGPQNHYGLAVLNDRAGNDDDALDLYRFAACLADRDESYSAYYFACAQDFGRADEALEFLSKRFAESKSRDSGPARSLHFALSSLHQHGRAKQVLDASLAARPEDGELLLYAANVAASHGRLDEAETLHERSASASPQLEFARARASLSAYRADPHATLEEWRHLLDLDPKDIEAHREVASLLLVLEGRSSAIQHLRDAACLHPDQYDLAGLLASFLRTSKEKEEQLNWLLQRNSCDHWARRELVDELLNEGRVEEALEQAELVRDQSNTEASGHVRVGRCLAALGRTEEAKRSYRRTLECDANDEFAFVQLMILASSDQERRGDLESLWKQVCRQPATEVGVELYVLYAKQFLPWNEVLDQLRAICAERPNSSGIRSELVRLLVSNGEHDEAEVEARRGTETYPEDAASWWTLSEVQSFNGSVDGAGDSVERAVNCAPGSISGLCRLASFRRDSGKPLEALELLERAKAQAPLSPDLRTQAAESLLKAGRLDDAERELVQALRISPAYRTAWIRLSELFHPSGRANELESVTQSILRERIDDSAAWILHSWMQDSFDSCREALERAVETTEPSDEAYDLLAELLQNEGRLDDAAEVLRDHRLSARLPVMLADRLATIEAQRSGDERERECLEELLRQQPSYSRAWYLLFLNAQRTDQPELRDRAAQNLTLSSPDVAIGHRMLGDCRTVAEDFGGALRAYQLAFDLNPSDDEAVSRLVSSQLQTGGDVEQTLEQLRRLGRSAAASYFEIAVHCGRGGPERCVEPLSSLAADETANAEQIAGAVERLVRAGGGHLLEDALAPIPPNRLRGEAARGWVQYWARQNEWDRALEITLALAGTETWEDAMSSYISELGIAGESKRLKRLLSDFDGEFHPSPRLWSNVTRAYVALREPRSAINWAKDWEARDDLTPNDLLPVAEALRDHHRRDDACEVSAKAIELRPSQRDPRHDVWLAAELLAQGSLDSAYARLSWVGDQELPPMYDQLRELAWATFHAHGMKPEAALEQAKPIFTKYRHSENQSRPGFAFMYWSFAGSLGKRCGWLRAWRWKRELKRFRS